MAKSQFPYLFKRSVGKTITKIITLDPTYIYPSNIQPDITSCWSLSVLLGYLTLNNNLPVNKLDGSYYECSLVIPNLSLKYGFQKSLEKLIPQYYGVKIQFGTELDDGKSIRIVIFLIMEP